MMRITTLTTLTKWTAILAMTACTAAADDGPATSGPLYPNSIVSNSLSFLELSDPSVSYCIGFTGRDTKEMPGSPHWDLIAQDVYVFAAHYADGTTVQIWASPRFASTQAAQTEADEIAKRLALLPSFMRETLSHVVLHTGDGGAFAEHLGHFFMVYADNMATRRSQNDMEETLFHESVHATMDARFRDGDPDWASVQAQDPGFVTNYARDRISEDLAESAIFAYADKYHPGRLPDAVTARVYEVMPARMEYLQNILPAADEFTVQMRAAKDCG